MLKGLHGSNVAATQEDKRLYERGGFGAVKLMWLHSADDVALYRAANPATRFLVRAQDFPTPGSIQNFPDWYAAVCEATVDKFYPSIVEGAPADQRGEPLLLQMGNEPQFAWRALPFGPWQYAYYMRLAVENLRERLRRSGKHVRLVAAPLAWSPGMWTLNDPNNPSDRHNPTDFTLDGWIEALAWAPPSGAATYMPGKNLWQIHDAVACNCYWQDPPVAVVGRRPQMLDASFGLSFIRVRQRSGMPIIIAEAGNSLWDKNREDWGLLRAGNAAQAKDYPEYLRLLAVEYPYVEGVYFYIGPGATWDWRGFRLTEGVASALRGV